MHAAAFNGDFYVMAATVIPVFLIALMIEGTFAPALLTRAITSDLESMEEFRRRLELARSTPPPPPRWTLKIGKFDVVQVGGTPPGPGMNASNFWMLPALGMVAVVAGEIFAVSAVSEQHASRFEHAVVLIDLIGLPVVVAVSAFASAYTEARKRASARSSRPANQRPRSDPPEGI